MALVGDVMAFLFQVLAVFLLLLMIRFVVPQLHPILYSALYLFVFAYVIVTILLPFIEKLSRIFRAVPEPYGKLLLMSAMLFFISESITSHISESGYASFANLAHFVVKLTILSLWLPELVNLIQTLTTLISP
ncbi:hypothetical protein [Sporosarcina sp. A2]|uniref:hypothetical protein n=1 Tax=Sporosarcina sp. A2 TaxID=3393449 RepID=UPI003D79B216